MGFEVLLKGNNMLRLWQGLLVALKISLLSVVISIVLGVVLGILMALKLPVS
jgi:polar amino acid transport system permease protein